MAIRSVHDVHYIVAEDSRSSQADYACFFLQLGITDYVICSNGLEALKHFESLERIDNVVFISDLHMPMINGEQLLMNVRWDCRKYKIPFVVVSTESERDKILDLIAYGANHFMSKPISLGVFTKKLQAIVAA